MVLKTNFKNPKLILISLAFPNETSKLKNQLHSIGYSHIDVISNLTYNPQKQNNKLHILLVDLNKYSTENIIPFVKTLEPSPLIGVFHNSNDRWELKLINYFREFLYWPCHNNELFIRLESVKSKENIPKDEFEQNSQEFIDLNFVGKSPLFTRVINNIKKISRCNAPVLIEGETGTGKELAAKAIHYLSDRKNNAFVPINCGSLPDNLIENELFGHSRGAYTDAGNEQTGVIEEADRGTLFLDEIEALSPRGQTTLLRFLQDQKYRPLGGNKLKQANVRIVSASNTSLRSLVDVGKFRQDLIFRLNIIPVTMPPLRDRVSDIELLADKFLNQYRYKYNFSEKMFHPDTLNWMRAYQWPGNIRELENFVHREVLLSIDQTISVKKLENQHCERRRNPVDRRMVSILNSNFTTAKSKIVDEFEKQYLCRLLSQTNGNVTLAAKFAKKERRALGKLIKKHNIDKESFI